MVHEVNFYSCQFSLTDIAKFKNPDHSGDVIRNWLRNRNTVEFLGVWERLNNPAFNPVEFDGIRIQTGLNSFSLTPIRAFDTGGRGSRRTARSPGSLNAPDSADPLAPHIPAFDQPNNLHGVDRRA